MAQVETVNIKSERGYTVINKSDFNPSSDELFLKESEILVKPKGVEDADPFIVDEKDFDENSYERVNATKKNLEIVAEQTMRAPLPEKLENKSFNSLEDNEFTRFSAENFSASEGAKSVTDDKSAAKVGEKQTPQTQLKGNQKSKK